MKSSVLNIVSTTIILITVIFTGFNISNKLEKSVSANNPATANYDQKFRDLEDKLISQHGQNIENFDKVNKQLEIIQNKPIPTAQCNCASPTVKKKIVKKAKKHYRARKVTAKTCK